MTVSWDPLGLFHKTKRSAWSLSSKLGCGFVSGLVQAVLLNPLDRALFLSVTHERPVLTRENFSRPFHAMGQALSLRAISQALYFPLEDILRPLCKRITKQQSDTVISSLLLGSATGTISAFVLLPLNVVRYHTYGKDTRSFGQSVLKLHKEAGYRVFFKGMTASLIRDCIFGACFSVLRIHSRKGDLPDASLHSFGVDLMAATVGTVLGLPFNYVRVIQFAHPAADTVPTTAQVFKELFAEIRATRGASGYKAAFQLLDSRLRLGWGPVRVGLGMAISSMAYEYCKSIVPKLK